MADEMSILFGQRRSLKRHLLFRLTKRGQLIDDWCFSRGAYNQVGILPMMLPVNVL